MSQPALCVIAPGLHTTLQDLGRFGYLSLGVPVAGALDTLSLRLANRLLGNPEGVAALEMLQLGPTLEVTAPSVRIAVTGTDAGVEVLTPEKHWLPSWRTVTLTAGDRFRVPGFEDSACGYLQVAGGFAVPPVLGSQSTYVRGAMGGIDGRPLRVGDSLPLAGAEIAEGPDLMLPGTLDFAPNQPVRVMLGPQDDYFTADAHRRFVETDWQISRQSDRMGMRLDGPPLEHALDFNIVSDGIATGAVQVPGSGLPIVLLADHQTTGGYPKIATVISADLPRIGRRRAGQSVRFAVVTAAEARTARAEREAELDRLTSGIVPAWEPGAIDEAALWRENLVTGLFDPEAPPS